MSVVETDLVGRVLTIRLNRPPVNAISPEVLAGLGEAVDRAAADADVRAVVVTGSHGFSAGADLPAFLAAGVAPLAAIRGGADVLARLEALPKPVVAAIRGHCLGGGLELALAADIRIASRTSRLGQPEVKLGVIPGWNGTVRLPRIVGSAAALDLILTGDTIDGTRAYQLGLVQRLVEDDEVVAVADNLARQLAANAPLAVAAAKRLVRVWHEPGAVDREAEAVARLFATPDAMEGITAFAERRRPRFAGKEPG
jgi:enoyl-CoA hydratase/carnithine racemase